MKIIETNLQIQNFFVNGFAITEITSSQLINLII